MIMNPLVSPTDSWTVRFAQSKLAACVASVALGALSTTTALAAGDPFQPAHRLVGIPHNSGFPDAHDTWNGMGCASDGKIYYVLSAEKYDVGGRMYCFDPKNNDIRFVGDLTEACGEKGRNTIVQGKSHVNFVESNGRLYFATHV